MKKYIIITILIIVLSVIIFKPKANKVPEVIDTGVVTITSDTSRAVFKIDAKLSNSNNQIMNTTASAVVIKEDLTHYYAITNYHVIYANDFSLDEVILTDYLNTTYPGEIVYMNQAQEIVAYSYDVALVKFKKGINEIVIPEVSYKNITSGSTVMAVGYPNSLRTVSHGSFIEHKFISGKVTPMIVHSAEIKQGNSGGGLFDTSKRLIGLNVAGAFTPTNEFIQGYAIPAEKINEFINLFQIGG